MNTINKVISKNLSYESVLIIDTNQQLHPAVVEIVREFERQGLYKFLRTVYISSISFKDSVYKRIGDQFISDEGLEISLVSKL